MDLTLMVGDATILHANNVTETRETVSDGVNSSNCHVIRNSSGDIIYSIGEAYYDACTDPNNHCIIGGVKIELR